MGKISKKFAKMIKRARDQKIVYLKEYAKGGQLTEDPKNGVKDKKQLIENGYDPLHATYLSAQNFISLFAEVVSGFPMFRKYYDKVSYAEDEYLPDGPPFSSLTRSYFTTWAFFDVQFGQDKETIGTCLIDVSRELKLSSDMVEVIRLFQNSRMGIYSHCGIRGSKVVLREIINETEFDCHVPAGYSGKKGQLWFVRRLPPVRGFYDYSVIFTTPYVLTGSSIRKWLAFLDRTLPKIGISDKREALHHLMKYGLETNYWNEYILLAYHHFQHDAIFLSGIPDIRDSLPHAD